MGREQVLRTAAGSVRRCSYVRNDGVSVPPDQLDTLGGEVRDNAVVQHDGVPVKFRRPRRSVDPSPGRGRKGVLGCPLHNGACPHGGVCLPSTLSDVVGCEVVKGVSDRIAGRS
jgi:hypothetical protein